MRCDALTLNFARFADISCTCDEREAVTERRMNEPFTSGQVEQLRNFAADELGSRLNITDVSRAFGRRSVTWKVETPRSGNFYFKQHEHRTHYHAEHVAYAKWVPKLEKSGSWHSPELVADSPELGALIVTEAPGLVLQETSTSLDERVWMHRTAGWLAAQIHALDVDVHEVGRSRLYAPDLFREYLELASPYVDVDTLQWVEEVACRDGVFSSLPVVPTHSDFSPRNWLIHRKSGGTISLGLIDWERARPTYWLQEAYRMVYDHWLKEPQLRAAFFEGYGRTLTHEEEFQLKVICLANALGTVSWATEHGDFAFAEFGRRTLERLKSELL